LSNSTAATRVRVTTTHYTYIYICICICVWVAGSFIIRAENVVVIGDVDPEWATKCGMTAVGEKEIVRLIKQSEEDSMMSMEELEFKNPTAI
jgi:hypothetical protein